MIVVSKTSDFQSRLDAVQSGSVAFFNKPVNVGLLLDKLDSIIYSAVMAEPPKVLVIDDSKTISEFLSRTLTRVGMVVHVETTPDAALAVIGTFNPDLILMDMYMPVCDGEDLCRIIRQYESFTSIPIVFLSSETDVQKQLNAMKIGADDFLTKEIDPRHLVTSITTRIQRHRILSSFMIRDSLTGLLNHTTSKKQLEQMMIKANTLNVPLCFAMVDIDHFKKVNDTYGHPTGDKVIKALSRLLQKRLRRTDSIGRYGGEEFAIVLWDTDAINAKRILDDIREDFSKIEHTHEGKTFFTTFSSGVAHFPTYTDGTSISNAADRALYVAKGQGRNQVCIATKEEE
jgi:diguanylate cyclase (GGDEF)-like protein